MCRYCPFTTDLSSLWVIYQLEVYFCIYSVKIIEKDKLCKKKLMFFRSYSDSKSSAVLHRSFAISPKLPAADWKLVVELDLGEVGGKKISPSELPSTIVDANSEWNLKKRKTLTWKTGKSCKRNAIAEKKWNQMLHLRVGGISPERIWPSLRVTSTDRSI